MAILRGSCTARYRSDEMVDSRDDSDSEEQIDLFPDPEGYYKPRPQPTSISFTRKFASAPPSTLNLRLVGEHSLWGHHLWNASKVLADYFDAHPELVKGKKVLELGAGGALPSFIAACNGAEKVVITDYPDTELIENIRYNVLNCGIEKTIQAQIAVEGYLWGSDATPLLSHLANNSKFDIIILSDTVFNHSEHHSLVKSLLLNLEKNSNSRVYVFYTHHRPWLKAKDLEFFDLATQQGFTVEDLLTERVKPMFDNDRGDETERGTVYGRSLSLV